MKVYDTLMNLLTTAKWRDKRHLKALVWMVIGLIEAKTISLPEWATFTDSAATYAQSTVRRFSRWMTNPRIDVNELYAPIIADALGDWQEQTLYLALDTSMLWDTFCLIRVSIVYRGRAVPIAWRVIKHGSAMVRFDEYKPVLDAAQALLPIGYKVVLLADRGFATTGLMAYCDEFLFWNWRIRCKSDYYIFRAGKRRSKLGNLQLKRGQARCLHGVKLTEARYGPIHLALAKPADSKEVWLIASSQPTERATFAEYGLRFDIEENFLDDKSNGFQLEHSRLRDADALNRLCFVLAVTTLFLVCQGTEVVESEQRRLVDAHWFRGNSYLKIGWKWIRRAAVKGWVLISSLRLSPLPDLEPCFASKNDVNKQILNLELTTHTFSIFANSPA